MQLSRLRLRGCTHENKVSSFQAEELSCCKKERAGVSAVEALYLTPGPSYFLERAATDSMYLGMV
jgi:hypothetical protein